MIEVYTLKVTYQDCENRIWREKHRSRQTHILPMWAI